MPRSQSIEESAHQDSNPAPPNLAEKDDADLEKGDAFSDGDDVSIPPEPVKQETQKDPNLVTWDGPDDPENPGNWSVRKKWTVTMLLSLVTLTITFASSVFSTASVDVSRHFHVGLEVSTLGTSLFVLGFCCGPIICGPLSELYGRMIPLMVCYFIFAIFQIPVAVAQNVETIMLCRFFGGFFGCAPLAIIGGALADFWQNPIDRGIAISSFAGATFVGPVAGPIVGSFITQSYLGWRWTAWITLIMSMPFFVICLLFVPEMYGPVLLQRRAARLRYETKNWALHAQLDEQKVSMEQIATKYLVRPFVMLAKEPILIALTLYMSLVYGMLYLFFEAFPISFKEQRGWSLGISSLPFLSITIGVLLGAATVVYYSKTRLARIIQEQGRIEPEERLIPMMMGGVMLPIGLFWFAWTSSPHITWVPQVISGIPIGMGVYLIFIQGLSFIIDSYLMNANSALAGNTAIRSLAGAGFPLFATQMYNTLGVPWATSLLAFLCVAMVPIPLLFFKYGKKIRAMSKFTPTL